ncbi:uracil-DNA glycosylase family protein [Massilia sp. Mn16-1_5]|uniref:uracil-DNA glycosylase n=1 Tax=Massilia sp. Mn16-1_5 TaxID=2079199 RepID=UPI00109E3D83|nr:uracil-DNA glycosylase [Massilia sp. Mn16-1_5]THC40340.1 uracil-DNA glycosylase [Massilia sp. Mn16-1_5]
MSLSERDEVFLAEMGIAPIWRARHAPPEEAQPEEVQAEAEAPAAPAPEPVSKPAPAFVPPPPRDPAWGEVPMTAAPAPSAWAPTPPPAPSEEEQGDSLEAIAAMDWDELRAAIARCTRCGDCAGRKPVYGAGPAKARWFVAAGATSAADEAVGAPLAGEAGKLLDNMLGAVGLTRKEDVYVTSLVKCRPLSANGGDRAPTSEEAAACRPFLERELHLSGAGLVLTLGQIAANGLLGKPLQEPLAGSRGAIHAFRDLPLVATLHPGELLRRGGDKALAWTDLCRARAAATRASDAGRVR